MSVVRTRTQPDDWLLPDLPRTADLDAQAPAQLDQAGRHEWCKARRDEALRARHLTLGENLRPGVAMDASFERGELRFFIDGAPAIERVFLDDAEGAFVLAQWKLFASSFSITESTTGAKVAKALRKVALTADDSVRGQIIARQRDLSTVEAEIAAAEHAMNARIYQLYGLTDEEIRLVEAG